jgi:hypothetical protein
VTAETGCIHIARRHVEIDGAKATRCLGCGDVDYNRWRVHIDSAGNKTEVHFDTGERREHVHDWQPGRYATGQGIVPCWRCSPCMTVSFGDRPRAREINPLYDRRSS